MAKTKVTGEYLKDSVVRFTAKAGENITKGNAVYISGISGELPVVSLADADDTAKMPAFGLAEATVSTNAEVEVTSFGTLAGLDTSSYTLGDILYVDTTAGALTNDPAGLEATKLQNIGIVQRVHASNGSIKVGGAGRTNAVPNLDNGDIFIGNSDNKAVSSALSTEIESYLDGGTSTPTFASATVSGALASGDITITDTSGDPFLKLATSEREYVVRIDNSDSDKFQIRDVTGAATRVTLDTSGNVGIGTDSPSAKLHIGGGDAFTALTIRDNTSSADMFSITCAEYVGSAPFNMNKLSASNSSGISFETGGSERMRLDSAGNLLYNTTGTAGSNLSDGGILFRRDSNTYMQIASGTESDTTLMYFYKKSGTGIAGVGDIKAMGNDVAINSTDEGRLHIGGVGKYSWSNTLLGPQNDNARDLGSSGARWKDAYLSGSLYVGGTAAANALDDYEEGTWTPAGVGVTFSSAYGHYQKIGNRVFVSWYVQFPSTSSGTHAQIDGLPFNAKDFPSNPEDDANRGFFTIGYNNNGNSGNGFRMIISTGTNNVLAFNFAGSSIANSAFSGTAIYGGGSYITE